MIMFVLFIFILGTKAAMILYSLPDRDGLISQIDREIPSMKNITKEINKKSKDLIQNSIDHKNNSDDDEDENQNPENNDSNLIDNDLEQDDNDDDIIDGC